MNAITLSGPVADAFGWTLLHAVWQGFALVLPVAILLHVLRNRSSALRYRVGVAGLLAQVLASVITFSWLYKPVLVASAVGMTSAPPQTLSAGWQNLSQTLSWPVQVQQFLTAHLGEFVLLYLAGVLVFAIRLAGGWLYLQRLSRTASQSKSDQLTALVQSLRDVMELGTIVRVRESAQVAMPMVIGVLKPILLLPVGLATSLSIREIEAVLAHELAHVKRHDYAVNLLQSVMEILFFFHPALWWLSARVREEREHCCDDLAVQTIGGDGRILAQALAHVEELRLAQLTSDQLATPALAMTLSGKRQLLLHRVRRMLGIPVRPYVSNSSLAGLTLATLLLLSISVYAVQPRPKPKVKTAQPKSTRRHTVDATTESGISGGKTLDYVIWKGQKLPASRVTKLQKLYGQVMAGQLNLDDVKQPDRDILLEIIEANYSTGKRTDGVINGIGQVHNEKAPTNVDEDVVVELTDSINVNGRWVQAYNSHWAGYGKYKRATGYRFIPPTAADSTHDQFVSPHYLANDSLPELKMTLAKLQYATAHMHSRLQTMEREWRKRIEKNRDTYRLKDQLQSQRLDLQKLVVNLKKLAERPSLASAKQALTNELVSTNQEIEKLSNRIDTILTNEIDTDFDRLYSTERRRIIDSIRVNESRIIETSRELDIEPVEDGYLSPGVPRPPKSIRGIGGVEPVPAIPAKPVPTTRPVPRPKPAPKP